VVTKHDNVMEKE